MKAALWLRVSSDEQTVENQQIALASMATTRGFEVVHVYRLDGVSAYTGAHREMLDAAFAAAYRGEFQVLLVWALDRLSRESAIAPFQIMQQFKASGVRVISLSEPWADTGGPFSELLALIMGWLAHQESVRISERTKAGLARRKSQGLPVGRQPGSKDKKPRRRIGQMLRRERERDNKRPDNKRGTTTPGR